jgi:hypothetical protein
MFTQLEGTEQIVVLPVDIAADGDWGTQLEKRRLRKKDWANSITQTTNSRLLQNARDVRTRPLEREETLNHCTMHRSVLQSIGNDCPQKADWIRFCEP